MPLISANTDARSEGYFRLEWKLAVDRSHLMADDQPFLMPVVIDDTPEATARVPDRFRERQWTRLPAARCAAGIRRARARLLAGVTARAAASGAADTSAMPQTAQAPLAHGGAVLSAVVIAGVVAVKLWNDRAAPRHACAEGRGRRAPACRTASRSPCCRSRT